MKIIFDADHLLKAPDYRGFLKDFYLSNKKKAHNFSYSLMAKKAGLASKGFIKDVIEEKKHLTFQSATQIAEGLNFPKLWKSYFLNLYHLTLNKPTINPIALSKENDRLRSKIKKTNPSSEISSKDFFEYENWSIIYAALGSASKGVDVETIMSRTQLPRPQIEKTLKVFLDHQLIEQRKNRYFCTTHSLFFEDLKKSQYFKNFFRSSLQHLHQKSITNFDSPSSTFYSMAFSVDSTMMPQFKKELVELLDKFTTECETAEGDRVSVLTCGMDIF